MARTGPGRRTRPAAPDGAGADATSSEAAAERGTRPAKPSPPPVAGIPVDIAPDEPARPAARRVRGGSGRFDTTLGLGWGRDRPVASVLRVVLYALVVLVFCGPLMAVFVGAFDANADPSSM